MIGYLDLSFRGGLVRARRLFEFFEHELPGASIESLPRPFAAVGTDLRTGEEVWMRKGSLLDALQASVAMPGLITPTHREGRWLVDGGLVNPVPVSLCRALGAYRDTVLLNAAAALVIVGKATDLKSGAEMARTSIDSGAAKAKVAALAAATNG